MTRSATTGAVDRFLGHINAGQPHHAIDEAVNVLERDGVTGTITGLLAPAQLEVGARWHRGQYTIAQEHLATGVVDDVLGLATAYLAQHRDAPNSLAMVCAEGEWHSTPARMATALFRDAGWRVQFFGASTPSDHLRTTLQELPPQAVAVSCSLPLALPGVASLVEVAHDLELPVIVGGRAFDPGGFRGAQLGADATFAEVAAAIEQLEVWLDRPPALAAPIRHEERSFERGVLSARHDEVVVDAYAELERRLPIMARFDDRQRHHTRQDLDYLLRFADVALLVDDPHILVDVVTWLADLLNNRGLPANVMEQTLEAMHGVVGADLTAVRAWLELASQAVAGDPNQNG